MKEIKTKLALILAACMVLNTVIPAYADGITAPEEIAAQQEMLTEDASPNESDYDNLLIEDDLPEASLNDAVYDGNGIRALAFEEASPSDSVMIRSMNVDGITITLTAEPGVFPEDAELWIQRVEDETAEEAIEEAVEKERDRKANVASNYKFDIKMLVGDEEIQPDTEKGVVKVTFTLEQEISDCLEANAYHIREAADGELTAENLGAEVKTVDEAQAEETGEIAVTAKVVDAGYDEDGAPEDGVIEDDVSKKKTQLEADTDGFSYYVVEFTYNKLQYVLPGDSSIRLSEILKTLAIEGTVSEAEVSSPELFTVTKDPEGDDWTVAALQAFDSEEWMKVTADGQVYEITVTDSNETTTDYSEPFYFEGNGNEDKSVWLRRFYEDWDAPKISIQYSTDKENWTDYIIDGNYINSKELSVPKDGKLYLRAKGTNNTFSEDTAVYRWYFSSDGNTYFKIGGNIMSLIYEDFDTGSGKKKYESFPEGSSYNFRGLFKGEGKEGNPDKLGIVKDASELLLPATTLTVGCYQEMFYICEKLEKAPAILPAEKLSSYCYMGMFQDCSVIKTVPEISATELADYCCQYMFMWCEALTEAPELPAKKMKTDCYERMFSYCKALETAPELPATELALHCYRAMFQHCSSLKSIRVGFTSWYDGEESGGPTFCFLGDVASSGTFYCPKELEERWDEDKGTYIPQGWEVVKTGYNTVKLHANDGSKECNTVIVSNSQYILPECPFHIGDPKLIFLGWSTETSGANIYTPGTAISIPPDTGVYDLYARWKDRAIHKVTFDANGGTVSGKTELIQDVYDESTVQRPKENPVWTNTDTFDGKWYTDPLCIVGTEYDFAAPVKKDLTLYAGWNHVIKWYDDTTLLETKTVHQGDVPEYTGSPEFLIRHPNKLFTGWEPEIGLATVSTSYRAHFEPVERKYIVSFNTNGGSFIPSYSVTDNDIIKNPEDPVKDGYLFEGWYSDPGLTEPFKFGGTTNKDITLHAKWLESPKRVYTITWKYKNDGKATAASIAVEGTIPKFPKGDEVFEKGYSFYGWKQEGKSDDSGIVPASEDITYIAKYVPEASLYCYAFFDGNGGTVSVGYATTSQSGGEIQKPVDPVREGYTFEYWYETDPSMEFVLPKTITDDVYLFAKWKKDDYKITWKYGENLTKTTTNNAFYGELPHFPGKDSELAIEGKAFMNWSPELSVVKEATTYTAQYIDKPQIKYYVSFNTNGGTFVNTQIINEGGKAARPASPSKAGYIFAGWFSDEGLNTEFDFSTVIGEDITLHAKWDRTAREKFNITWKYKNDKSETKTSQAEQGDIPECPVSEDELKDEGWVFYGWKKAGATVTGLVPVSGDSTYEAMYVYRASLYNYILYDANGGFVNPIYTAVSSEGGWVYEAPAATRPGYDFLYWYYEDPATHAEIRFDFPHYINDDYVLHAKWKYNGGGSGGGGGGSGSGGGGGSAGGPSTIIYTEKPAVTPVTIAPNGAQMMGTAVVSMTAAQLAKIGAAPVPGTWSRANGMWTFTKADGNKAKNEWVLITVAGGNASYFYFDSNANMVTGWQQVGGKWMYFNNESGSLLGACLRGPGRTPDGYEIDAAGAWTGR